MLRGFSLPVLLLSICCCGLAFSQDGSTVAIDRANLERTGVYPSSGVLRPQDKVWGSDKLFVMKRARMEVGQGWDYSTGPPPFNLPPQIYSTSFGFYYSAPIVFDGTIYFSLYIGDGYLFAVNASTGKLKWKAFTSKSLVSYPSIADGQLYFGAESFLHAIDLKTQREVWKFKTEDSISPSHSPLAVGGVVYFGSSDGNIYALDAKTGQEKWVLKTGQSAYWISPAYLGGTIYCAEWHGMIRALNAGTGKAQWTFLSPNGVGSIAVAGDVLYFVDYKGFINALDVSSGKPKPEFRKRNRAGTSLALYDGKIYFGGWHAGNIHAIDAQTGESRWKFQTEDPCNSPVIAGGLVNFTCTDQKLYAVDAKTGKKSWSVTMNESIMSAPTISEGAIYFISDDGKAHAIK